MSIIADSPINYLIAIGLVYCFIEVNFTLHLIVLITATTTTTANIIFISFIFLTNSNTTIDFS